jgi:hypothetical protein
MAEASGIMRDRVDVFDWSGGHPALDLVNTLDERPFDQPIETLVTYRDLVMFVELAGLVEPSTAAGLARLGGRKCSDALERTRELREHLHDVCGRYIPDARFRYAIWIRYQMLSSSPMRRESLSR